MRRRASRRRETLQQVKDEWEARINALRVIDLDIEDKYEAAREEIENAASVDDIKAALRGFLG
jgi:NADP-dependent 3-hydroxy acid dehydrogenase YdfG